MGDGGRGGRAGPELVNERGGGRSAGWPAETPASAGERGAAAWPSPLRHAAQPKRLEGTISAGDDRYASSRAPSRTPRIFRTRLAPSSLSRSARDVPRPGTPCDSSFSICV